MLEQILSSHININLEKYKKIINFYNIIISQQTHLLKVIQGALRKILFLTTQNI